MPLNLSENTGGVGHSEHEEFGVKGFVEWVRRGGAATHLSYPAATGVQGVVPAKLLKFQMQNLAWL